MITPWIFYENPLNILNEYIPYIFPHTKNALYSNKTGLSFTYLEVVS